MELLNPPQDPNVADSTVIDENKIGVELSDRQNYLLRRGVGSNRPESETLDKMSGKFITTENAEKWAKLRQRIAQVRLAATFGKGQSFYVSQGVIDSFKSRKPFRMNQKVPGRKKQYSFQTDGNTLFQLTPDVPQKRYEIASWDDEGNLNWSFENHDSSSTIQAGKMLGIDIERKGGQMFVNGEYMDHTTIGKPRKIPKGELQSGFVSKGKGRKPMTPEQYERSKRQTSYRHKSRAYWRKQEGVLGEQITDPETGEIYDQATIQPYQQRQINKALGFPEEHNVGTVTPATQFHHGIPAKTLEKMGIPRDSPGAIRGSTPLSHKTHMEVEHPEATTHPGNVMANRIRKKLKKARLKIARIRQRNISRGVPRIAMGELTKNLMQKAKGNPLFLTERTPVGYIYDEDNNVFLDATKRADALTIRKKHGKEGEWLGINSVTDTDFGNKPILRDQAGLRQIERELNDIEDIQKDRPILGGYENSIEASYPVIGDEKTILSRLNKNQESSLGIDPQGTAFLLYPDGKRTQITKD